MSSMIYQIKVSGCIDASWSEWFGGMTLSSETGPDGETISVLTGMVIDQAALRGILTRLWDLNLAVRSVNPLLRSESHVENPDPCYSESGD